MKQYCFLLICTAFIYSCNDSGKKHDHETGNDHQNHGQSHAMSHNTKDYADSINNGLIINDTLKGSPERIAMANIGHAHIHITYHSPGVKGRIIWGGLVPYGQVWVSGAHNATNISFSKDVTIMGKPVRAGTYAFFTIPVQDTWVAILNTKVDQHLADEYKQQEDVARFDIKPVKSENLMQRLTYSVVPETDTSGNINLEWEKIKISIPVVAN